MYIGRQIGMTFFLFICFCFQKEIWNWVGRKVDMNSTKSWGRGNYDQNTLYKFIRELLKYYKIPSNLREKVFIWLPI